MRWNLFDVPRRQTQDDRYLQELLNSKGEDEQAIDRQVKFTLLALRWRAAIAPYLRIFKLAKEFLRGQYRTSATQVHSRAYQAPGTGYSGAFVGTSSLSSFVPPSTPSPAATFADAGIRAGEVTGYRCWELRDGLLYSMYQSTFCWKPGEVVEGDAAGGDGVHAFKDILAVGSYGYTQHGSHIVVSGTVDLWGEVYEHERGYRASKAAIASIDDSPHYDAKALRKLYGLTRRRPSGRKPRPKNKS